jgi:hypothetical protein
MTELQMCRSVSVEMFSLPREVTMLSNRSNQRTVRGFDHVD